MARAPKLRKKTVNGSVYWYSRAGGDTYFGRVDDVSHRAAAKAFADHLSKIRNEANQSKKGKQTAGELIDLFLVWVRDNRAEDSYEQRRHHCSRFAWFEPTPGVKIKDLAADSIKSSDLEAWLASLKEQGLSEQTRLHAETSVRHAWNWATKHPSPTPYLPRSFRPFSAVEKVQVPLQMLKESDLITLAEIEALFKAAAIDGNQFRRHGLHKSVEKWGVAGLRKVDPKKDCFVDLLRCYHATGARTHELVECKVEDVQIETKQILLGRHKRLRKLKEKKPRQVSLNAEALAIFQRHCEGKQPCDYVFLNQQGKPWTVRTLAKRFERLREIALGLGFGEVRRAVSLYDYRHRWISDALMAGVDVATVARMAGTSISMVERTYGHFSVKHLQSSQDKVDAFRQKNQQ